MGFLITSHSYSRSLMFYSIPTASGMQVLPSTLPFKIYMGEHHSASCSDGACFGCQLPCCTVFNDEMCRPRMIGLWDQIKRTPGGPFPFEGDPRAFSQFKP